MGNKGSLKLEGELPWGSWGKGRSKGPEAGSTGHTQGNQRETRMSMAGSQTGVGKREGVASGRQGTGKVLEGLV